MVTAIRIWDNHDFIAGKTYEVINALRWMLTRHALHTADADDFIAAQNTALLAWVSLRSAVEHSEWVETMPPNIDIYFTDKFSSETVAQVAMQLISWLSQTHREVCNLVVKLRDTDQLKYV